MPKRTEFTAAEWFSRYSRAIEDMRLASSFATLASEHHRECPRQRDERRLAYSLAFVVTYARPFTAARDWPDLQKDALPYLPGDELSAPRRREVCGARLIMSPSPAEARDAMRRVDHARDPEHVIVGLREVVRNLVREIESWSGEPNRVALVTADTTTEGVRRLLGALRIAVAARSQRNAA